MRKIIFTLFATVITYCSFGQSALADLQFEEAEKAFVGENFREVIANLDAFDKTYGSVTAKSLYLRIVSQDKLFDYHDAASAELTAFRKNVNAYLKAMEKEGLDDKFRAVYNVSLKLNEAVNEAAWREMPEYKEAVKSYQDKDYASSMNLFKKAAEKGNAVAASLVGSQYEFARGVAEDYSEAMKWKKKAADKGYAPAMQRIGVYYEEGLGVAQNYAEAMTWYKKAADLGNVQAMVNVGYMFDAAKGVPQNNAEAMAWYKKAAANGNSQAMNNLGLMYHHAQGVPQNYTEAMNWYRKAAEKKHSWALRNIGYLYANGQGVTQNYAEAMNWYKKAAEQYNTDAMKRIADLYFNGQGVEKNIEEAVTWYNKVLDNGDSKEKEEMKKKLGEIYLSKGWSAEHEKKYDLAMTNYKKSFEFGTTFAAREIAALYRKGLGVPKDKSLAKEWEEKK